MAWFRRRKVSVGTSPRTDGPAMAVDLRAVQEYFRSWEHTRVGVEAFVEPSTSVSATTMVLVGFDGEWTRRAVGDPAAAFELGRKLGIPTYDVNLTGYPPRMRAWTARKRRESRGGGSTTQR